MLKLPEQNLKGIGTFTPKPITIPENVVGVRLTHSPITPMHNEPDFNTLQLIGEGIETIYITTKDLMGYVVPYYTLIGAVTFTKAGTAPFEFVIDWC